MNVDYMKKDLWNLIPTHEKFLKKLFCIFNYVNEESESGDEIPDDSSYVDLKTPNGVNQELVKSVVYGESRILEKKVQAAKQEITLLKVKEKELRYTFANLFRA